MSNAALSYPDHPSPATAYTAALVLAAWLLTVVWLGAAGALVNPPGSPPLSILAAVLLPLAVFFTLFRWSRAFRDFVLSIDQRLVAGIQAWRFAGFGFLALYAHGVLPGIFAFPAGLGDMAIGIAAPWMALRLGRNPGFATSNAFRGWNWLGILDLVVAVSLGGLSSFLATGAPGEVTTQPMAQMPLVLIPAYFVPIFVMLHVLALYRTGPKP
jgi:hypothetical protein